MKVLYKILAVMLLCALFIGGVSAAAGFTLSTSAVIEPSGVLQVGDKVTAVFTLALPQDDQRASEKLVLKTDLDNAGWIIYVNDGIRDITHLTRQYSNAEIYGQYIKYDYPIKLRFELTGSIPKTKAGKNIHAFDVGLYLGESELSAYTAPEQYVYNTANFPTDVAERKTAVSKKQAEIASYAGTGVSTGEAQNYVNQAASAANQAESYGTADINRALASLETSDTYIAKTQEALNYAILNNVAGQISAITNDINTLNVMKVPDKATLLSVSANSLTMMYNSAVETFKTDKSQDLTTLFNTAAELRKLADDYVATATPPTETAVIPTPTQTSVIQPTATPSAAPTSTQYVPPTTVPNNPSTPSTSVPLDNFTKILLIVIVVLAAGLVITAILLHNANKNNKKGRKKKDKWESL